jgi:manganese/zinc/iron transport system substrate-binding protein
VRQIVGIALAVFSTACVREAGGSGDGVNVVATTGMIADIVENVGGEHVSLTALMGPGIDPHLYKASAGDVTALVRADVIFYNGLHLEAAMGEVLEEMGSRIRTVAVTEGIDRSRLLAPPEFAGAYDPHVWFDVSMWMTAAESVARALAALDTAHRVEYEANARVYLATLDSLHRWVETRVSEIPADLRVLITAHDAFNYFGRAYGVEVLGLQGISTATEAGTADVQRLAEVIVRRRIPAIFVETSVPRRTVEAVQSAARARGVAVRIGGALFSDAMGSPGTPEGTYVGMVRHNVNTIVDALKTSSVVQTNP